MIDLIERLEAATEDSADLMREAFAVIYPEPAPDCEPAWRPENPKQPIYHAWKTRQIRFEQLLRAEAYESAALTLVPEGEEWGVHRIHYDNHMVPCAFVGMANDQSFGATPALAICIAALKARMADD